MGTELQREKCSCSQQPSLECRVEEKVFGAYDLGRGEEGTDELSGGGEGWRQVGSSAPRLSEGGFSSRNIDSDLIGFNRRKIRYEYG